MQKYTVDTTTVISYFIDEFEGAQPALSKDALEIFANAFIDKSIILYFPSIIFIEIFSKWFNNEETAQRIKSNVYTPIFSQDNFAIESFDKEVLENFIKITDIEDGWNFDNHDKQVLATAMKFQTPLITSDERLIRYNRKKKVIPKILS